MATKKALCAEIKQFRAEWADKIREYVGRSKELKTSVNVSIHKMKRHAMRRKSLRQCVSLMHETESVSRSVEMERRQR